MKSLSSHNPATGELIWKGSASDPAEIEKAFRSSKEAQTSWVKLPLQNRIDQLKKVEERIAFHQDALSLLISKETGKPLWESKGEVTAVLQKFDLSIRAYQQRCPSHVETIGQHRLEVSFRPQGILAVFGPFNFPMHLPNGHIVPALLAGNGVIFKPSDKTPATGEALIRCFWEAGLPDGLLQIVQGGSEQGKQIASHPQVDGLLFTGSHAVGKQLNELLASQPEKILALEMGGNNALIISSFDDPKSAAYLTIQSAFISSGQRCSAARKLIVIRSDENEKYIETLIKMTAQIRVGAYTDVPEPFMGPLIDHKAFENLLHSYGHLVKSGAEPLISLSRIKKDLPFASPAILDCTGVRNIADEECFGPLLQLHFAEDLEEAIDLANQTRYGLAGGIVTKDPYEWHLFSSRCKAGIINWNMPLTGASSKAPFGGRGFSGNNRPSGFLAADYCSYPVASLVNETISPPITPLPGLFT